MRLQTGNSSDLGNFAVSAGANACGSSLNAGTNCQIYVTFTPTGSGTLSVTDNASGSPHTVALSGTGADFSVSVSPPSQVMHSTDTATFVFTLAPVSGFAGSVQVSCSNVPATMTCSVAPTSVVL